MTPGYSATPLIRKLGIKDEHRVVLISAPAQYTEWIAPVPPSVEFSPKISAKTDLVHLFVSERKTLRSKLESFRKTLKSDAVVWVSWPKKASKLPTDITEDTIREEALPLGFVDIKVCAVSDIWSGLKLMVRKELR